MNNDFESMYNPIPAVGKKRKKRKEKKRLVTVGVTKVESIPVIT